MKRELLPEAELLTRLKPFGGWAYERKGIQKNFEFRDFNEAFGFLSRIALLSERLDHHAEWSGVYNKVQIRLNTHDSGGVTETDLKMAEEIEGYLK